MPIRSLTNMAQKSKDEKQTYEHYIKPVKVIDNFEEVYKLEHRLIRSYDELYNFYKNEFKPNTFFAFDTETTSLNAEQGAKTGDLVEGKIVGYSFTQDGHIGYYVPVSHPDYSLGYKALKILYAMICRSKLNLLYNCRFDMRFLEAMTPEKYDYTPEPDEKIYKFDLSGIKYIDVQNTVWLADTNLAMPSLKKSEKHFLGWNPPTFSETIGDESNFGYLPAEQGYKYASIDALGTYHLFFKTEKYYAESGAAAKLDNDLLYPLMRLENTPINVDHNYLQSMRGDVLKHLEDLKKYLFETAGREYNINSGRELVTVFQQLGIDTGKRTKTGIMETNIKAIEGYVASHGDSEYLSKLIEYKKLLKFDNSYLEKMLEMSEAENVAKHPIRFCYFTNRVPTGRLASGTDGKNSFFSKLNFQSLPKPHSHNYHVHKATPEQIANGEDLCGYIFNDDPNGSLGLTEGQDPHLNVRKAFCPVDNDSVVVSVDMKAEELRLVANIYKEQTWIKAFNSGQDVHKSTACKIFGEENYCKEARKKAKCISGDSLLYTDMGIIKIRDVNPNRIEGLPIDVDFNISTPEGVCRCSKFIYNGNKNTIKFHMNNGATLEVTPDHLVRSDNKWVRADSLHIGDYIDFESVAIDSNNYQTIDLSYINGAKLTFSKELSYYIGAILGDGNISRKNVYFMSEDYELIQYMSSIVKQYNLGEAHENIQKYTKTSHRPFIRLNCGPKKARDLCRDIGLIDDAGHKQFNVPDVVLKSPNDVKFAFIQGIFDTDGTISKYNGHKSNFCLDFCTKSNELAIGCMNILRSLGVSCRICRSYNKVYKRMYYKVKLRATSARRFLELGGFKCIHKQDRLKEWCKNVSFIKEYKKHYMIESIENSSTDVYDLTIENETHSFLANGFVVHNCASFGILYGSSAYGFHNQFPDMTLEECEEFIEKFKAALPSIEAGQKASVRYAKKNGFVKTYFGRPRRVKYYLNHPDRSMRSFGERTVKNTAVQGAAGDCLKLMIIRLWKELFSKYPEIKWVGSIHDEITYIIPKSILIDALKIIKKCQTIKLPDWPVQLDCDISIGKSFGELIPWFLDDETGELTPQLEEIKHEQVEEKPENKVNEYDMLLDADEYDYLQ